jgi:hypothetical protein
VATGKMRIVGVTSVIVFGLIGQMGCWGLMIGGQVVTTLDNALIIHAVGAPFVFALVSFIYFKKLNYTKPLTAISFVAIVILMDFFIVALLINQSFDMFLSPIGTWIPFALIFTLTYLTGSLLRSDLT